MICTVAWDIQICSSAKNLSTAPPTFFLCFIGIPFSSLFTVIGTKLNKEIVDESVNKL